MPLAISIFRTVEILAAIGIGIILIFANFEVFSSEKCADQVIAINDYAYPVAPCKDQGKVIYDLRGKCLIDSLGLLADEPCLSDNCQGELKWKKQPFEELPKNCDLEGVLRFIST